MSMKDHILNDIVHEKNVYFPCTASTEKQFTMPGVGKNEDALLNLNRITRKTCSMIMGCNYTLTGKSSNVHVTIGEVDWDHLVLQAEGFQAQDNTEEGKKKKKHCWEIISLLSSSF